MKENEKHYEKQKIKKRKQQGDIKQRDKKLAGPNRPAT